MAFSYNTLVHSFYEFEFFTSLPYNPSNLFNNPLQLKETSLPPQITYLQGNSFAMNGYSYTGENQFTFETLILTANEVVIISSSSLKYSNRSSWLRYPNLNIYVPDDLVDSYKNSSNWDLYFDKIRPLSEFLKT